MQEGVQLNKHILTCLSRNVMPSPKKFGAKSSEFSLHE